MLVIVNLDGLSHLILTPALFLLRAVDDPVNNWLFRLNELFYFFLNFNIHHLLRRFLNIDGLDLGLGTGLQFLNDERRILGRPFAQDLDPLL